MTLIATLEVAFLRFGAFVFKVGTVYRLYMAQDRHRLNMILLFRMVTKKVARRP